MIRAEVTLLLLFSSALGVMGTSGLETDIRALHGDPRFGEAFEQRTAALIQFLPVLEYIYSIQASCLYSHRIRQAVVEQLFKVNQLNISLSTWINCSLPLHWRSGIDFDSSTRAQY